MNKYLKYTLFPLIAVIALYLFLGKSSPATKLYWFIPDGMRADTDLLTVYKWAEEGKLPNIKKMMDKGSYGYSIPDFPSHTPVNFAALLTGTHPLVNGVADGPMRIEGKPLEKPSVSGFSSAAKKVSPIWTVLEAAKKKVALLSIPGSTPPESKNTIIIRGRWGNWGQDDTALIFQPKEKQADMKTVGAGFKLFYLGENLTRFIDTKITTPAEITSYSPIKEAKMSARGLDIYAFIVDSTNDNKTNYNKVYLSYTEDGKAFAVINQGDWTDWFPVKLTYVDKKYDSNVKIKAIKIWENGQFRIRILYNNLNEFVTQPSSVAKDLTDALGPMVDFVDNFPPQLIYEPEDKQTFLEEVQMSLDYHKNATKFVFDKYNTDVFLQDIYTPNQMLTSRWWMRFIDPKSPDYSVKSSEKAMAEVLKMYQGLDSIIGEALKHDDGKTLFVLSSDHGIILQTKILALNNLFASKGWLNYKLDPQTGEVAVDWANTKVIYLQTNNIYINPNGLAGPYKRATGASYDSLKAEVVSLVALFKDADGVNPVQRVIDFQDAPSFAEIPQDRIGDLILEINPGFGFSEGINQDLQVVYPSLTSGNKQAYDPKTDGLQTPFVIMGPGVRHNYQLPSNISHVDQMPTILSLMGIKIPNYVQGRVLSEIKN